MPWRSEEVLLPKPKVLWESDAQVLPKRRKKLYSLSACLFMSRVRHRFVTQSHSNKAFLRNADIWKCGQPSLSTWFTIRSSPPSCQSTAPGARSQPRRGGCGDIPAAGGPARWKATATACACWPPIWTPGGGAEGWCTPSTGCATSASDRGCLRCVRVPVGNDHRLLMTICFRLIKFGS